MPTNVLITGGGPAGLEAALALHRLAGDHVDVTVLAPEAEFTYRPLSVLSPFAAGGGISYPLDRIAEDAGFTHVRDRLASVDVEGREVRTEGGERLPYDALLIASGARAVKPYAGATVFTGSAADQELLHGIVQDVEEGYLRSIAFVVPSGASWPLPLYELALMLAGRAFEMCARVELHLVTPETEPLGLFGDQASREVRTLLSRAGVRVRAGTGWTPGLLDVQRVVTVPQLEGPSIPGLGSGFLATDEYGRVKGAPAVYAAGDVTAFPIKQGGIACQQAYAAALHIAAKAGALIEPEPFRPDLKGLLLTGHWARYLRPGEDAATKDVRGLRWPPTKIAGRELPRYLKQIEAVDVPR